MVILRLSLGCHFFYEGVWKIKHPEFSAEGYLRQAKGPAAPIFYAMVPDMDGTERLKIEKLVTAEKLVGRWREVRDKSEVRYTAPIRKRLAPYNEKRKKQQGELSQQDQETVEKLENEIARRSLEFKRGVNPILWEHEDRLEALLAKNEKAILAHFDNQESTEDVKRCLSAMSDIQNDYFGALNGFAGKDKDIQAAVARSVKEAAPVFDDGVPVEKLVGGGRLRAPKGQEILRATRALRPEKFYQPWNKLKQQVISKYDLDEQQQAEAERIYRQYKDSLWPWLGENRGDIAGYLGALDRLRQEREGGNTGAAHQKQRLYNEQIKLRGEVGGWLSELQQWEDGYRNALWAILTDQQKQEGALREGWTRMDLINLAVTYGLTAIGLCLLLGLFTRPAALGGACFMLFVVLSQPSWPTIYPPPTPAEGHALLIDKGFIEMIGLFLVAATAVGRWGGLDYFLENYVVHLYHSRKGRKKKKKEGS